MEHTPLREITDAIDFQDKSQCNPLNYDVTANAESWIEIEVLAESEERVDYYNLPKREGTNETTWFKEHAKLDIYDIPSCPHTVYANHAITTYYACIHGETPSVSTLLPWEDASWSPWSYSVESVTTKEKHGWASGYRGVVLRNGKTFGSEWRSTEDAARLWCLSTIENLSTDFHPIDLRSRGWKEEFAGTQFRWKTLLLTVGHIMEDQLAFCTVEEVVYAGEVDTVKLDFFDGNIDWFPDGHRVTDPVIVSSKSY